MIRLLLIKRDQNGVANSALTALAYPGHSHGAPGRCPMSSCRRCPVAKSLPGKQLKLAEVRVPTASVLMLMKASQVAIQNPAFPGLMPVKNSQLLFKTANMPIQCSHVPPLRSVSEDLIQHIMPRSLHTSGTY